MCIIQALPLPRTAHELQTLWRVRSQIPSEHIRGTKRWKSGKSACQPSCGSATERRWSVTHPFQQTHGQSARQADGQTFCHHLLDTTDPVVDNQAVSHPVGQTRRWRERERDSVFHLSTNRLLASRTDTQTGRLTVNHSVIGSDIQAGRQTDR